MKQPLSSLNDPIYFCVSPWSQRVRLWIRENSTTSAFNGANMGTIQRTLDFGANGKSRLRFVLNLPAKALEDFLQHGHYYNTYTLPAEKRSGTSRGPSATRKKVDEALGLSPPENYFFGAIALGGTGVRFYGEYCLSMKLASVPEDTRIFDRNSYDIVRPPLDGLVESEVVACLGGLWPSDVVDMLSLKVVPATGKSTRLLTIGQIEKAILDDEDFAEVHFGEPVTQEKVEEVRQDPADEIVENSIIKRFQRGTAPTSDELLWVNRRARIERLLEERGISRRLVTDRGRAPKRL